MVIVLANAVSLALLCNLLFFKLRENATARREHKPA
jgi:hypothetical protein